jgi:O-antigen ligase
MTESIVETQDLRAHESPSEPATAAVLRPTSPFLDSVLVYGLFGLLMFGPLAFGEREPWSVFVLQAATAALFLLWLWRQVVSRELRVFGSPLFAPMLAFAMLIGVQLVPGMSAYRHATVSRALLYCAYGTICFLLVQCVRHTKQLKRLAVALSIYGCVVALFAVLQSLGSNGKLYWLRTPDLGGWIYGPYVNHNHYAGLMEMLAPIPLVLALTRYVHGTRRVLAATAAACMISTVFLSGSRGGMLAIAIELAILGAFLMNRHNARRSGLVLGAVLVISFGLLAWLGGGELTERMASIGTEARQEVSGGTRLAIARDGLRMFAEKPVIGWGLGTFPEVYPQYRTFYTNFFVNAAHNDYVQILVETGTLGFAIMLWFVVVLCRHAARKLKHWHSDLNGALALATLLGVIGILVHSALDFNLQIPANASIFYAWSVLAALEPRFAVSRRSPIWKPDLMQASA